MRTATPGPTASALRFRLDPWAVDYGTELPLRESEAPPSADLSVERAPEDWGPIVPSASAPEPERLVFVDGVRRIEARVLARDGDRIVPGAFGSYAVGAVVCSGGHAGWGECRVGRVLALGGGVSFPEAVEVAPGLRYRPVSIADAEPDAPVRRLQDEMRQAEETLARSEAEAPGTLVVADGPLRFGDAGGSAVGYVKRLFERYGVPLAALAALAPGSRTPLVSLTGKGFARYSWFVRLATRGPADFELAGIARLEVSQSVGLEAARRLADGSAHRLPALVPGRARDPRSPQNLLPIGALEAHLRRLLGDPALARRHIESHLAAEAASHD